MADRLTTRRVARWAALGWTIAVTVVAAIVFAPEGWLTLLILSVPLGLAAIPLLPLPWRNETLRGRVTVACAALVAVFAFVTGASIGLYLYPTAVALAVASDLA